MGRTTYLTVVKLSLLLAVTLGIFTRLTVEAGMLVVIGVDPEIVTFTFVLTQSSSLCICQAVNRLLLLLATNQMALWAVHCVRLQGMKFILQCLYNNRKSFIKKVNVIIIHTSMLVTTNSSVFF